MPIVLEKQSATRTVRAFISSYGPALFVIGAVIGTGSVSSLVWAGAEYGMSLLWAIVLSCVFFWVLIASVSRLTFASGKTFVGLAREQFGTAGAFYVVLAVVVSQFTSNIGVLSIVSEAFTAWAGVNIWASTIFWGLLLYVIIALGGYSIFERVLILCVTVLGIAFIVNMFLAHPSARSVVDGLIPSVPPGGEMIAGAMVGTTLAGSVVVMRSYIVREKGWTLQQLRHADRDAIVSAVMILIMSAVIMACSAATLHVRGMHVDSAIDMAFTLVPLMGEFAATLFVVGIVAAGLSSAFPNALVSIWCITDFFGMSRDPRSTPFRLMALPFCTAGLLAPIFGGKPVLLQIMSLALQAIFLPVLVLFLLILTNRESLVGEHRSSRFMNAVCIATLLFSMFMAYQAFVGLSDLLR